MALGSRCPCFLRVQHLRLGHCHRYSKRTTKNRKIGKQKDASRGDVAAGQGLSAWKLGMRGLGFLLNKVGSLTEAFPLWASPNSGCLGVGRHKLYHLPFLVTVEGDKSNLIVGSGPGCGHPGL